MLAEDVVPADQLASHSCALEDGGTLRYHSVSALGSSTGTCTGMSMVAASSGCRYRNVSTVDEVATRYLQHVGLKCLERCLFAWFAQPRWLVPTTQSRKATWRSGGQAVLYARRRRVSQSHRHGLSVHLVVTVRHDSQSRPVHTLLSSLLCLPANDEGAVVNYTARTNTIRPY